uniref:Cytochrome b5 heme-binding domain-containing protein n=1 Tax=Heterorhabditis bacteriophora TaxID=37862 RepID=A0A1I7WMY9_HETBA
MMTSSSTASLDENRNVYCPTVSKTTVWRTLKANPFTRREEMRKCPTLTADHKKARYKLYSVGIIFSDVKKFNRANPEGFSFYKTDLRKERRFFPTRNIGGGSLMGRNIIFMDWLSRSPDLNPSENLWGILVRQVYAHNRQLSSIEDLKKTVSEE